MLQQITEGVWVRQSEFLQSNAVVVQGTAGVLLIDPGITNDELAVLAKDIQELGQPVVAGFSTHPHWDHLLWHAAFGEAPRYGTARAASEIRDFFASPDWKAQAARMLPEDIAAQIPVDDLFGRMERVYGKVLPGYGPRSAEVQDAVFFVIGPNAQLDAWARYIEKAEGKDGVLYRLYPRDFWVTAASR